MQLTSSLIPSPNELANLEYAQIFTVSSILQENGKGDDIATFDLTVREMPGQRNFLLFSGIEEIVNTLLNWRYDSTYVDYLVDRRMISPVFGDYMKSFQFRGDVYAMPEGTIFFPGEPVVRITAPLQDANLFPAFLSDAICFPTLFFSKAVRVKLACSDKPFICATGMRQLGFENLLKSHRLAYLLDSSLPIPYIAHRLGIQKTFSTDITLYHALIKAFDSELDAFRAILNYSDADAELSTMVDTYDLKQGINNFITIEKEARRQGKSLGWAIVDSGDILESARFIRKELDKAGLDDVPIAAASNLDEFKIAELEKRGAPIDVYGAGTEVTTISDRPVLEAVYKLAAIDKHGRVRYVAKLTPGKQSLPGCKQVFRRYGSEGTMKEDIIGLETEELGDPLLIPYVKDGRLVTKLPELDEVKSYLSNQLQTLPKELKSIDEEVPYPLIISSEIQAILESLKTKHIRQ